MQKVIAVLKDQIKIISGYYKLKADNAKFKKNKAAMSNQISLLNKRITSKNEELIRLNQSLLFMGAEQDKRDEQLSLLQEKNIKLQEGYDSSEIEREKLAKYANDLMVNNSMIVQKLFLSLNERTFSVLAARKISSKPFASSIWEVLFIDKGDLNTVMIERYVHDDLLNVMRLVETAKNVDEVLENSLHQSSTSNRGVQ